MSRRAWYRGDRAAVMTACDLAEWEALERIDPSGPERGDMQAGIVARAMAAYGWARPSKLPAIGDYVLRFGAPAEETERQRVRRMRENLDRAAAGAWFKLKER